MEKLLDERWRNIITIDSENEPIAPNFVLSKKFPIHSAVGGVISQLFNFLNRPNLEERLCESVSASKLESAMEMAFRFIGSNIRTENPYDDSRFVGINFKLLPQKLFAEKIIECNGYSVETCLFLKTQLGFRTNSQLLKLLGVSSKSELFYDILKINLDSGKSFISLVDKNFNSKPSFPFQKFTSFSRFLRKINIDSFSQVSWSLLYLLNISLYNGRKPSFYLDVNWNDITEYNANSMEITVKTTFFYRKTYHNIPEQIQYEVKRDLEQHLKKSNSLIPLPEGTFRNELICISEPNLTSPFFLTNRNNRLTQQSLNREIKSFLKLSGFVHFGKFKPNSTCIMFGRRILEIKGNHLPTLRALKQHFNFYSTEKLLNFLHLDGENGLEDRKPREIDAIMYDIPDYQPDIFDEL